MSSTSSSSRSSSRRQPLRQYPRFMTFQPGEREAYLRQQLGLAPDAPLPGESTSPVGATGRSGLIKAHAFAVTFPDGTEGACLYDRRGPGWHLFHFTYRDGASLPVQYCGQRLANYLPTIEAKGKELAEACYLAACERERKEYFARTTEGAGRKRRPEKSRMKTGQAKELGGRYALYLRIGSGEQASLVRISPTVFEKITDANTAWRDARDRSTGTNTARPEAIVVACCNRLDRCWEIPRYNSLYAEFDPRDPFAGGATAVTTDVTAEEMQA